MVFLIIAPRLSYGLESSWDGINEAKLRIISPVLQISTNGDENIIGLEYKLKKNWKTYWKSPGAGGFPQEINFSNSDNIKNIKLHWPTPEEFSILGLKSLGYLDQVVFPISFKIIDKNKSATVNMQVDYLVCKDICIPGNATLNLIIPVGKEATLSKHAFLIEKFLSLSPISVSSEQSISYIESKLYSQKNNTIFEINIEKNEPFNDPKIYIHNNIGLPVVDPTIKFNKQKTILDINFYYDDTYFNVDNADLSLHVSDKPFVEEKKIKFKKLDKNINFYNNNNLINIFLISILAGFILNFMPCVLPVLSIKFMSVINYSSQEKSRVKKGFLFSSIGIIISYISIGFFLAILKITGVGISWGMQFQNPIFLMFISLILLLFSLNLIGLYEFSLPRFASKFSGKFEKNKSYTSDFFNGFFATLMATPCSAPFVGTAITFAFTQEFFLMLSVFFFMGLGMALPYIMVFIIPSIIYIFPKPGRWTIWLQRLMAVLVFLTLIWITTILNNHFNIVFIYFSIFVAILISIIFFLNNKNRISKKYLIFLVSFIAIMYFSIPLFINFDKFTLKTNIKWNHIENVDIPNLLKNNKIVFVDITADWCVTCKYNKQNVIYSNEVEKLFFEYDVVMVQGDWTLPNENIRKFLNKYNRYGIPFNIIYSPTIPEGLILPELLSKNVISDTILKAKGK